MDASDAPLRVFCSFAPEDADLCYQLHNHLRLYEREGTLTLWHQRLITAGIDWTKAIDEQLTSATIILLLISPAFFASDYCYGVEMQQAIQKHEKGEARVIPILIRSVSWQEAPFSHLSVLPASKKPVTLWSNRDAAFTEIAVGIRRVVEELLPPSIGTSLPRGSTVWTIPFQRHPFFTGQQEVLKKLAETLQTDQSAALTQPQAITGLGGIGKTQIAVEYAWRHRRDYQYVLWSRADTHEALISGYVSLAGALNLPEQEEKDQMVTVQAVLRWLSTHVGWLLILDNVDDLAVLKDFLLPERQGHLLLTTRIQATGTLAHPVEVQAMPQDVGAILLLRRAGRIVPNASLDAASSSDAMIASAISEELGGLPLALDQAGAYIDETQCSLIAYQERYRSQQSTLLKRRGNSSDDYPASVATTWTLSFNRVEKENLAAAALLRCCAFLHPDTIPEQLFTEGATFLGPALQQGERNSLMFDEAVRVLRSYSLIRRDPSTATLSIHRLVQAVLLDTFTAKVKKQWQERVMQAVNALFPEKSHHELATCERLLPHALVCIPRIEDKGKPTQAETRLLAQTGKYLRYRGQYTEAEPLLLHALAIREQHLGPEHPDTAESLNDLAHLYWQQGKYEQAEPLCLRALAIREQRLGPEHPDTAESLNDLAVLYHSQDKYEQAEPLFQRALAIREQQLGPEHPETAGSLNDLAVFYWQQGKYKQTELLFQRALLITENQLGTEHPLTANILNNLAYLYHCQSKYEQAKPLFQRALTIREQHLGLEHPLTARSLNNLAELYLRQGKYEQAEPLFQRALAIREQRLGPENLLTAESLNNLAELYWQQGKCERAEPLFQRVLAIREQRLGATHPKTMETRERFIAFLHSMSRMEEVAALEKEQNQCRRKSQSSADENQK